MLPFLHAPVYFGILYQTALSNGMLRWLTQSLWISKQNRTRTKQPSKDFSQPTPTGPSSHGEALLGARGLHRQAEGLTLQDVVQPRGCVGVCPAGNAVQLLL